MQSQLDTQRLVDTNIIRRKQNTTALLTPCKFYSGVCGASNRGFSHDHHVLPDADDHRNPLPKSASQRYKQALKNSRL